MSIYIISCSHCDQCDMHPYTCCDNLSSTDTMIFSKFVSMYQCMSCSTNEHVKFISKMAKMDARSLINNNLQTIASQWHINIQDLIDVVPVSKPNLADKLDDEA